jgi:hypothetical protein
VVAAAAAAAATLCRAAGGARLPAVTETRVTLCVALCVTLCVTLPLCEGISAAGKGECHVTTACHSSWINLGLVNKSNNFIQVEQQIAIDMIDVKQIDGE